ncbi:hypothetical protein AWW67_13230 [Roseivirga seohaensis]|jgi:hypothetical protein|uniref:TerB family tellurite resistance protein n=1 Tax=Roseivirga seohaensis TaxID=1914963 RepID=A0A150XKW6_9BACT|nr:hypothetical protein [Roseivirga seohaensis]KYG79331.1 hypothetical protein AWW67_13230 [Roseivirga seohaensis]|tara:strand:+ start:1822 stop:2481 length:660 start_codon:yes stop_codon:yes gene_type:complete
MASSKHSSKLLVLLMLMVFAAPVFAQNTNEWIRQKKTQKRYLIEQIIGLYIQASRVKKGYDIMRKGWNTVEQITDEDYGQHSDFFAALNTVSPAIKKDYRVLKTIQLQSWILKNSGKVYRQLQDQGQLQASTLLYTDKLLRGILSQSNGLIDELLQVLSNDRLELDDAERMERLENIYQSTMRLFVLQNDFTRQVLGYSQSLIKTKENLQRLKYLNDDN